MKGVYKCFGLLLPLFTMVGLSLSVSLDVNAYKYSINTLPLNVPNPNGVGSYSTSAFGVVTSNDVSPSDYNAESFIKYYSSPPSSNDCGSLDMNQNLPYYYESSDRFYAYYGFEGFTPNQPLPSSWDRDIVSCLDVSSRTNWSGFFQNDLDTSNGLYVESKFDFSDIFGFGSNGTFPNTIYSFSIPLGTPSQSVVDSISPGFTFDFSGEFVFDFDDLSNSPGLSSNTDVDLRVNYFSRTGGDSVPYDCSSFVGQDDPSDPSSVWYLKFDCPVSMPSDFTSDFLPYFVLDVGLDYLSSNTKLRSLTFDSVSVVTNNDDSLPPSDDVWGDPGVYGLDPDQAPGSAKRDPYEDIKSDGINWTRSLIDLFQFNVLNPFAGIFDLFNNQDACVNIPIIAGMLHAENSTVCPWFDSSVRAIATPVLGLASVMLLLGFFIRWLSGSSGNMFIDNDIKDTGGSFSLRNRNWRPPKP